MRTTGISPLNEAIVHKICSGQVVVSLASAVKELVENSIDAGASKIEIKLKEHGSESIEVLDNGHGIKEADFETISRRHSTSKLRDFDGIQSVNTFGFRGEALSSLCQLAKVVLHTCAADAAVGTRVEFDSNGNITSRRPLARPSGTTVIVNQLFHDLPVRRRQLLDPKHLAKEFTKLVNLLTAYCLGAAGVQITCYRLTTSGEKSLVVSNGSADSIRTNISSVYGYAQLNSLIQLAHIDEIPAEILDEFNLKPSEELKSISLQGFISRPANDTANNSPVSTGRQSSTGRSSADRQFVYINKRPCDMARVTRLATDLWRRCCREALSVSTDGIRMPIQSACSQFPFLILMFDLPTATVDINLTPDKRTLLLHHERYVLAFTKAVLVRTLFESRGIDLASLTNHCVSLDHSVIPLSDGSPRRDDTSFLSSDAITPDRKRHSSSALSNPLPKRATPDVLNFHPQSAGSSTSTPVRGAARPVVSCQEMLEMSVIQTPASGTSVQLENRKLEDSYFNESESLHSKSITVDFSLDDLRERWHAPPAGNTLDTLNVDSHSFSLGYFRATQDENAESELSTYFSKSSFGELQIVGQFNLGFIIARHRKDLFIIDQHASDEKCRFEQLCENYRFSCQPLVCPQQLALPISQEQLLLNNLDVFEKNGFLFKVDHAAPCGQQVHLVATPMLEDNVFGRSDIEEMLFVLAEGCSRRCRPSRLRDILASRSCRSAVMIGDALDRGKMLRIVRNMAGMDHPWNCPHGRPTIRHLFSLDRLVED
ncbi:unnamed protein product [Dicrocoelium dendriticum]|nr:unnamed protein product [Dicrocoelium dendriticum]